MSVYIHSHIYIYFYEVKVGWPVIYNASMWINLNDVDLHFKGFPIRLFVVTHTLSYIYIRVYMYICITCADKPPYFQQHLLQCFVKQRPNVEYFMSRTDLYLAIACVVIWFVLYSILFCFSSFTTFLVITYCVYLYLYHIPLSLLLLYFSLPIFHIFFGKSSLRIMIIF